MSTALLIFVIVGIPVLCGAAIAITAIIKGSSALSSKNLSAEETKILQEIHQGLERMEKRIDALETIVIDKEKQPERTQL
ncbi:hypothetical protein [Cerasicoccus fimbriatus]|uniref:hypothetical protein n=1 Tax=Cerasicoccus fimbriatus TaxID=3014554 RepID=UPI0022B4C53C|nr:hypothetical protein [Cerasicoccus sp. TK19100]